MQIMSFGIGSFVKSREYCQACENEKSEAANKAHKELMQRQEKERIKRVISGDFGNIPPRFRAATLSDFGGARYNKDSQIYITGKCGTGKTHLSVALMKEFALDAIRKREHPIAKFFNFQKIAIAVKSSFGNLETESMQQIVSECQNVDFAIIDDICTARPTATEIDALYLITNHRYENYLPTVYTTNLSIKEIASIYGDRVASRLADCERIVLEGSDRRIK